MPFEMTELESQYAEWAQARLVLQRIFERARPFNVKDQCFRVFELNLLYVYPLIPEYAILAQPESAANIIAIINSELPEIGTKILAQILAHAKSQLKEYGGEMKQTNSLLLTAYLYKLKAIDAFPLLQLLICLKNHSQWRLIANILAITGKDLEKASRLSYEYIKENSGEHGSKSTMDIVLDQHKTHKAYDITELTVQKVEFDLDNQWPQKTQKYEQIKGEILGEDESESENESSDSDQKIESQVVAAPASTNAPVIDTTNREQVAMKKTIYLTIMSSLSTQEACHKLLALNNRDLVVSMLYETCKQQKIYNKSFGSIGYHLARASKEWETSFAAYFPQVYQSLDDCSTPEIRNMGTLSGYLLASDSIGWDAFHVVKIDPDNSTPSNRIFLQSIFEELRRELGFKGILKRFSQLPESISGGVLPYNGEKKALMFSINFFTAIKMGPLTDDMRVELKRREQ